MKRTRIIGVIAIALLISAGVSFWGLSSRTNAHFGDGTDKQASASLHKESQPRKGKADDAAMLPSKMQERIRGALAQVAPFDDWILRWRRQAASGTGFMSEGLDLAKRRREAMKTLIALDPRSAIEHALPRDFIRELPEDIRLQLESHVDAYGRLEVQVIDGFEHASMVRQVFIGGKSYDAFTYGARLQAVSKDRFAVHGIALDTLLAFTDQPFRRLESDETASLPAGANPDSTVVSGDGVRAFASTRDLTDWSKRNAAAEQSPGPGLLERQDSAVAADTAWVEGEKRVLWIRALFPGEVTTPAGDDAIQNSMGTVNLYYQEVSRNKTSFQATILPDLITTKKTKGEYSSDEYSYRTIRDEMKAAAKEYDAAHGNTGQYDPDTYDRYIIVFSSVSGFEWSGLATVGSKGLWLNGTTSAGVVAHELGHNQGLRHSHCWKPTGSSTFSPGEHVEYGDTFDVMGTSSSIPSGHFNVRQKSLLNYLAPSEIQKITSSGTYRIKRTDSGAATGVQALQIPIGGDNDYWIESRQTARSSATIPQLQRLRSGVLVHWGKAPAGLAGATGEGTYLLDFTPTSSAGMMDAAVGAAETFTDPDLGLNITPLAAGGTEPDQWIDVSVSYGATGSNHNPVLSFTPPASLAVRQAINFTASGTDPDGDSVYFRWDFGDNQTKPTTATVTHKWLKGGSREVTVSAVDGKGGIDTKKTTVTIADPLLTWTRRAEGLTTSSIYAVLFAGNRFVAASSLAILSSGDGVDWSLSTIPANHFYYGLAHSGSAFLAVGMRYDTTAKAYYASASTSVDGLRWTDCSPSGTLSELRSAAYGAGRFVAVGDDGLLLHTTDGSAWTKVELGLTRNLSNVRYASGRFVASGASGTLLTSTDGVVWQNVSVSTSVTLSGLAYSQGNWYASSGYTTFKSADGLAWAGTGSSLGMGAYSLFASAQGFLIAPSTNSSAAITEDFSASDSYVISTGETVSLYSIAEGNGTLVAVGAGGAVFQSGTPTRIAPQFGRSVADSTDLFMAGRGNSITTVTSGFSKIQLLVDGQLVAERTGDSPTFSWTPAKFGSYAVTLRGVAGDGSSIESTQMISVGPNAFDWRNPMLQGNDLESVTYAFGRWWAVGDDGTLLSSADARTWRKETAPTSCDILRIAFDGTRLVMIASYLDSVRSITLPAIYASSDGATWVAATVPSDHRTKSWYDLAYADGTWLVVGYGGAMMSSSDGVTWAARSSGTTKSLRAVRKGNGLWIAAGDGLTAVSSSNASTWSSATSLGSVASSVTVTSLAYASSRWVATTSTYSHLSSGDGLVWTALADSPQLSVVAVAGDQFVGTNPGGELYTSGNGLAWVSVAKSRELELKSIQLRDGLYVAVGSQGEILSGASLAALAAVDGAQRRSVYAALPLSDRTLLCTNNYDYADGRAYLGLASLSSNGEWQTLSVSPSGSTDAMRGITQGGGRYVAVGGNGTVAVSTDASNWSLFNCGTTSRLTAVAYGAGTYVCVGESGAIMSSGDALTWTSRSSGTSLILRAVTYGNGRFVAVGDAGTLLSSTDGATWQAIATGTTVPWKSVVWKDGAGFLAAGYSSADYVSSLLRSTDGLIWSAEEKLTSILQLRSLAVSQQGLIGVASLLYFSGDNGLTWIKMASPGSLNTVACSEDRIVLGGYGGLLLTSATRQGVTIGTQPQAKTITLGGSLLLLVEASSDSVLSYQWYKNGAAIPGATAAQYSKSSLGLDDAGTYTVVVTNAAGSTQTSQGAVVAVEAPSNSRLSALAIRTESGPGAEVLIVGVVVSGVGGGERKSVIVRGLGPTLERDGLTNFLRDPEMRLYAGPDMIASNDDWDPAAVLTELTRMGLNNLPTGSKDAVMLSNFSDGAFTLHLGAKSDERGVVMAEVYESQSSGAGRLAALAVRAKAGTGDKTLIGGFVVGGQGNRRLLIRGLGPTIADIIGPGYLADPKLDLFSAGAIIKSNDNWGNTPELLTALASIGMTPMAADSKDAAMLVSLPPGPYSVHLTGANNTTGIAMFEIYELP